MIKKYFCFLLFSFIFLGIFQSFAKCGVVDLTNIGTGARSIALGKTQVAVSNIGSLFINPAGLAKLDKFSLTSLYNNITDDFSYSAFGIAVPIKEGFWGCFGIATITANTGNIYITTAEPQSTSIASTNYNNRIIILSYGKELNQFLNLGIATKLYSVGFDSLQNASATGGALDIGFIFYPNEKLTFGLAFQDILFGQLLWKTGEIENIPLNIKMGLNFNSQSDINLLLDYDSNRSVHVGLEWLPKEFLCLRYGMEMMPINAQNFMSNYFLGVGLTIKNFDFDYAYAFDPVLAWSSTHYFSISFVAPIPTIENPPLFYANKKQNAIL